jgi:hypothetical protein
MGSSRLSVGIVVAVLTPVVILSALIALFVLWISHAPPNGWSPSAPTQPIDERWIAVTGTEGSLVIVDPSASADDSVLQIKFPTRVYTVSIAWIPNAERLCVLGWPAFTDEPGGIYTVDLSASRMSLIIALDQLPPGADAISTALDGSTLLIRCENGVYELDMTDEMGAPPRQVANPPGFPTGRSSFRSPALGPVGITTTDYPPSTVWTLGNGRQLRTNDFVAIDAVAVPAAFVNRSPPTPEEGLNP